MKLDVEGGEYRIISSLLFRGALCHVNEITIEWHDKFFDDKDPRAKRLKAVHAAVSILMEQHDCAVDDDEMRNCRSVTMSDVDDESYHVDPAQFPEECRV